MPCIVYWLRVSRWHLSSPPFPPETLTCTFRQDKKNQMGMARHSNVSLIFVVIVLTTQNNNFKRLCSMLFCNSLPSNLQLARYSLLSLGFCVFRLCHFEFFELYRKKNKTQFVRWPAVKWKCHDLTLLSFQTRETAAVNINRCSAA